MDWNTNAAPNAAGVYLVSAERAKHNGKYVFSYTSWYDDETDRWYKFDPTQENTHGELLDATVIAWTEISTFIR